MSETFTYEEITDVIYSVKDGIDMLLTSMERAGQLDAQEVTLIWRGVETMETSIIEAIRNG